MHSSEERRRGYLYLYERILGRVSVHDIVNPQTGELIVAAGDEITESIAPGYRGLSNRERRDPFSAHLREQTRRLHEVLRT